MPEVYAHYESIRYCNRCGQLEDRNNMRVVTLIIEREARYIAILCPKCVAELKNFYNKKKRKKKKK